jgi:hypothetical protein
MSKPPPKRQIRLSILSAECFVCYLQFMSEDWRVDSHDRKITQLQDKLREARTEFWNDLREAKNELRTEMRTELHETNNKIRALEDRPSEWLVKVMPVIVALLLGACIALLATGVLHKH